MHLQLIPFYQVCLSEKALNLPSFGNMPSERKCAGIHVIFRQNPCLVNAGHASWEWILGRGCCRTTGYSSLVLTNCAFMACSWGSLCEMHAFCGPVSYRIRVIRWDFSFVGCLLALLAASLWQASGFLVREYFKANRAVGVGLVIAWDTPVRC